MQTPDPSPPDDKDEQARAQQRLEFYRLAQHGVFSHSQLRDCRLTRNDIARMVRRRELRRVHPRVYVDHTGPLSHAQQEWAALLYAGPAALCRALTTADGANIHVAVAHHRQVSPQPGVVIHRLRGYASMVDGRRPPAIEPAHEALMIAHRAADELGVVAAIAAAAAAPGHRSTAARRVEASSQPP